MTQQKVGFIGCGNMASSLIGGLVDSGYAAACIWACDSDRQKLDEANSRFSIHTTDSIQTLAEQADVIVLAVKPMNIQKILLSLQTTLADKAQPLLMSVAAGILIDDIEGWAGRGIAVVRAMPNTPALVRASVSILCANAHVSDAQRSHAESIMRAVGLALWVEKETAMDAVTAVSGSGPAYYFYIMEMMEKIARDMGLEQDMARLMVLQTAYGAAKMAMENNSPVTELRARVTSPGGTTERAIEVLHNEHLEKIFEKALQAARERSRELSQQFKDA